LCRQQAEVIQNHEIEHVRGIGQGEATHTKYKRLKLVGGQAYDRSSDYAVVVVKMSKIDMICFAKPVLTEDLYIVHKEKFSITCYMCDMYT
jgi:hypothetical protein